MNLDSPDKPAKPALSTPGARVKEKPAPIEGLAQTLAEALGRQADSLERELARTDAGHPWRASRAFTLAEFRRGEALACALAGYFSEAGTTREQDELLRAAGFQQNRG